MAMVFHHRADGKVEVDEFSETMRAPAKFIYQIATEKIPYARVVFTENGMYLTFCVANGAAGYRLVRFNALEYRFERIWAEKVPRVDFAWPGEDEYKDPASD